MTSVAFVSGSAEAVRAVAGIIFLLLAPGLALTRALFPDSALPARRLFLLSIALSFAVADLGSILLDWAGVRLDLLSWTLLVTGVMGAAVAGAKSRGGTVLPASWRVRRRPRISARSFLLLAAAAFVTAGAVVLSRTPLPARGVQGDTALWLLPGPRPGLVRVGVSSSELRPKAYSVVVVERGGPSLISRRIRLTPGETWTRVLKIPASAGTGRVLARLYVADSNGSSYRLATLLVPARGSRARHVSRTRYRNVAH